MTGKDTSYHKVLEAFDAGGCPVCALVKESVRTWMEWLLYERVSDPKTRFKLRASRGFCRDHALLMLDLGSPLPVAIIYRDVIELVSGDISSRWAVPKKRAECPACAEASVAEGVYISAINDNFEDEEMQKRLKATKELCLPHIVKLSKQLPVRRRSILVEIILGRLANLDAELAEIIRKSDYSCEEEFGPEGDAWIRIVKKMIGG